MVSLLTRRYKRTPIGLDIGGNGIRAVQLSRHPDVSRRTSGGRYILTQSVAPASCRWIHHGAPGQARATEARSSDDPEHPGEPGLLSDQLQTCVQKEMFRGHSVVVGLNPPAVEFHALELPPALLANQGSEVTEAVRWEVARLMSDPVDSVETRHWPLPPTPRSAGAPKAIGVAARRDAVLYTLKACDVAGLVCIAIDTGATALARFGTLLNGWNSEEVWGVLDLGFADTRLALCVDGVPVLVRRAGAGGRAWTESIANSLQLSFKAAEVHKCDHGIALTERGIQRESDETPSRKVASILLGALRTELKSLASEVKRSYEYVLSCYPNRRVADLVLVGGGAGLRNLPEFMSDALGIPVRRASDYLERESCRLSVASIPVGSVSRFSEPGARATGATPRAGAWGSDLEVLASAIGLAIPMDIGTDTSWSA